MESGLYIVGWSPPPVLISVVPPPGFNICLLSYPLRMPSIRPSTTAEPHSSELSYSSTTQNTAMMNGEDGEDGSRSSVTPTAKQQKELSPTSQQLLDKDKPRLTEQEKKSNHIASEQKRRAAIREGFDRLTELVPGLEGQGRSENIVLKKTVDHMRLQLQERQQLIAEIESRGGRIDEALRP